MTLSTEALKKLSRYQSEDARIAKNLVTSNSLGFEVFSGQKLGRLQQSHAKNIVVHGPDGHSTNGMDRHVEDLKAFFVFAPNTRIDKHPARNGQFIQPTDKACKQIGLR